MHLRHLAIAALFSATSLVAISVSAQDAPSPVPAPMEPMWCSDSEPCADGSECIIEACPDCDADTPDCECFGYCDGSGGAMERAECYEDWECGDGNYCEQYPCPGMPCIDEDGDGMCDEMDCYDADGDGVCDDYGSCGGVCMPHPDPDPIDECYSDSDCGPGAFCAIYECPTPDCPEGEECPDFPVECGGVCVDRELPDLECWDDIDCPEGQRCEMYSSEDADRMCDPDDPSCGAFVAESGICVDDSPWTGECSDDADCGDGFVCESVGASACEGMACDPDDGDCFALPCEPEEIFECVPAGCTSDDDCAAGLVCMEFGWEECTSSACASDEDCMPDTECTTYSEAYCAPAYIGECDADADCGERVHL